MKIRDYKRHTFEVCEKYRRAPTFRSLMRVVRNLRRWMHGKGEPYNYTGQTFNGTLEYCSDRMNPGRAKALLKLLYKTNAKLAIRVHQETFAPKRLRSA